MSIRIILTLFALLLAETTLFSFPSTSSLQEECATTFAPDRTWLDHQGVLGPQLLKISKDKKAMKTIFEQILQCTTRIKKTQTIGNSPSNFPKNRCPHFIPFDDNIPCRDTLPNFYISGSEVLAEGQKYLLVQAPLQETLEDFWRMIITAKSPLIVTTVTPYEGKGTAEKCVAYWKDFLPMQVDQFRIERVGTDEIIRSLGSERIVQRLFRISNPDNTQVFQVTQLHYEYWKDNSVPQLPLFQTLLRHIDAMHLSVDDPITVHCHAGMGRTGTFVTAYTLHQQLRKNKDAFITGKMALNIPKCVLSLRIQRKSLVANPKQLQFIYQSCAASFKELLGEP